MRFVQNVFLLTACGSLVAALPIAKPDLSMSDLVKQKVAYGFQSFGQGLGGVSKALSIYAGGGKKSAAPRAPAHTEPETHTPPPTHPPTPPPQIPAQTLPGPITLRKREAEAEPIPFPPVTGGEIRAGEAIVGEGVRAGETVGRDAARAGPAITRAASKDSRKTAGAASKLLATADSAFQSMGYAIQAAGHPLHQKRTFTDTVQSGYHSGVSGVRTGVQAVKEQYNKMSDTHKSELKTAGQVALTAAPFIFMKE
jgi:hypothetical protein